MKPIIKIENVSKQYRLGLTGTGTFSHDVNRWWHNIRGKEDTYIKTIILNLPIYKHLMVGFWMGH